MALDANLIGGSTGNKAEVDNFGNNKVTLPGPGNLSQIGYAALATINHDGLVGSPASIRAAEISVNKRLRVSVDNLLFQDCFNYASQNSGVWTYATGTFTLAHVSGFVVFNSGASTASGGYGKISTYKFMPLFNGAGLSCELDCTFTQPPQTNNVIELGLFQCPNSTGAITDGIFFRITAGGVFQGVVSYSGVETAISLNGGVAPSAAVTHSFLIRAEQEECTFWVDNILYGRLDTPNGQNGPCMSTLQPITARSYNTGATSVAQQLKVGEVRTFIRDISISKPWSQTMAGMGQMGAQAQPGSTMGQTALYANSAVPTAAVPTNTTAALGTGLGGNFWHTNTLAVNTDGIISSFLVPAGTAVIPGKSLVITGVRICTSVQTTLANAGGALYQWGLAFGHNALSLATAEGATSKAPRRVALGIQGAIGALAQGSSLNDVWMTFASPVVVNPGEYVQTITRNIGTVGTGGVLAHTIAFDAHWE